MGTLSLFVPWRSLAAHLPGLDFCFELNGVLAFLAALRETIIEAGL
jgi:hypothetical protein